MSIILQNVDEQLKSIGQMCIDASDQFDIDECSGLFVDWISTKSNRVEELVNQTEIVKESIKNNKKIIIFDRYRSIDDREFQFLSKYDVTFWEPALFPRNGFHYQPCWVNIPNSVDDVQWTFDKNKRYDVGYKGSIFNKIEDVTMYYKHDGSDDDEVIKHDIEIGRSLFSDHRLMLLLGTPEDYKSGFLDPIFIDCINEGVIPVIPQDHKWYHAMFGGLIVRDGLPDLKYHAELSNRASFGQIYGLLSTIGKYHPEMASTYVMNRIINHFK